MKGQYYKYLFLFIQFILYISFLVIDIFGGNILISNYIKFSVVVLCLLYVLFINLKINKIQHRYLLYAMVFTVVSDVLILLSDYYFYGVLTFIIAQQLHGIRISMLSGTLKDSSVKSAFKRLTLKKSIYKNLLKDLFTRLSYQLVISFAIGTVLWYEEVSFNGLLAVSIFYFISILSNTVRSLKISLKSGNRKNIKYLAAGFVLFLLCDINVGLFNISDFISLGKYYNIIYSASSILMWTFYAPSQVLLALSIND